MESSVRDASLERPEHQFILHCAMTPMNDADSRIRRLLEADLDWDYLVSLSILHGLHPLLFRSINGSDGMLKNRDSFSELKIACQRNADKNALLAEELLRILDDLDREGIRAIPLKGPVLAVIAYDDLSLRVFGDLDVWIPPEDFDRAMHLLCSTRYRMINPQREEAIRSNRRRGSQVSLEERTNGYNLELHWRLHQKECVSDIPFDEIWKRRISISVQGIESPCMRNEDLLLFLSVHGAKHGWRRLAWCCDVARLIQGNPDIDWEFLIRRSIQLHCYRRFLTSIMLVRLLFAVSVPTAILDLSHADKEIAHFAKIAPQQIFGSAGAGERDDRFKALDVIQLRLLDRANDRIRLTGHIIRRLLGFWLVPNEADRRFLPLPDSLYGLLYLIRPIRIFMVKTNASFKRIVSEKRDKNAESVRGERRKIFK